jgi:hypothetical protein
VDNLYKAIESAIANKNWYAALFIALSIPDICGHIESPTEKSQARYEQWFEKYMLTKYSSVNNWDKSLYIYLSPSDCYALRCALLHEGRDNITEQRAREALDRFHFIEPPPNTIRHCNQINNVLQLQVDIFCRDILEGLTQWHRDIQGITCLEQQINAIFKVYPHNEIPGMSFGEKGAI